MTCHYCGTALPDGALFCGECGQPVTSVGVMTPTTASSVIVPAARTARNSGSTGTAVIETDDVEPDLETDLEPPETDDETDDEADLEPPVAAGFSIADLAFSSPGDISQPEDDDRDLPDGTPLDPSAQELAASTAHCPQCGEPMAKGDVFCGECGFVVRTVSPPMGDDAEPPTSSIVVMPDLISLGEFPVDPEAPVGEQDDDVPEGDVPDDDPLDADAPDPDATTEVEPVDVDESWAVNVDEPQDPDPDPDPDEPVSIDDLVLAAAPAPAPETDSDPDLDFDEPLPFAMPVAPASPSPRSRPIPDPFPWGTDRPLREDIEATRLIADPASGTRYVLQFSTGESVTVSGSGLVGRNPSVQPGEYVDQLVPIFDAGKSVSKTHLEFGQESGRFWVSDRYSTNGSVIRQPDAEPRRCDAGRRYFIARGTRVDVGEQFFVVS